MSLWPHSDHYAPRVRIESWSPTLVSTAISGKTQRRSRGAHRWRINLTYPAAKRETLDPIWAFANGLRGQYDTCTIVPSYYAKLARGTISSGTGTGAAGATAISSSGSGTLKAGDFIKFASHDKVYQVIADGTLGSSISITPALIVAISSSAITFDDVPFTVGLASDLCAIDQALASIYGFTVDLIEVI